MRAEPKNLLAFLSENYVTFNIPVYQRNYSWKKKQWERLISDIENIDLSTSYTKFLGSIIYLLNKKQTFLNIEKDYDVIDGQQRLITFSLLLFAMLTKMKEKEIHLEYLEEILYSAIFRKQGKEVFLKLKPVSIDMQVFKNLLMYGNTQSLKNENIKIAYDFFFSYFETKTEEDYMMFFNKLQRLNIVEIGLDEEIDSPQDIFESLNTTGLSLTKADLIRNFLLMGFKKEEQEEIYLSLWRPIESYFEKFEEKSSIDKFFKYYLESYTTNYNITEINLYHSFIEFSKKEGNFIHNLTTKESIMQDIDYSLKLYKKMTNFEDSRTKVNTKLKMLELLDYKEHTSFLFILYKKLQEGSLSEETFLKLLNLIEIYIVRASIVSKPSTGFFSPIKNETILFLERESLNRENEEDFYFLILNLFIRDMESSSYKYKVSTGKKGAMPSNALVRQAFKEKNFYSDLGRFILKRINSSNEKELLEKEDLQIEHIMPQTIVGTDWIIDLGDFYSKIHETYLHNIGNLTLTGFNQTLSQKNFRRKKEIFSKSNIEINKYFNDLEEWGEKEIKERNDILLEEVLRIWHIPKSKDHTTKQEKENFSIMEILEMDEPNIQIKKYQDKRYIYNQITSWNSFVIHILENIYKNHREIFLTKILNNPKFQNNLIFKEQQNTASLLKEFIINNETYYFGTTNKNSIVILTLVKQSLDEISSSEYKKYTLFIKQKS